MLKYMGGGFVVGVPARNLTEKEIEALGVDPAALVLTGLYKNVAGEVKKAPAKRVEEPKEEIKPLVNDDEGDLK